ncbi:ABC transporter substrate-binding protein (plasmid) [Aquicoccus sp. G2-2]|uniref:ABC transporter substrate-binding protein n=1 Tax=Aquicoccus sp. G2-2 TaxID=3092120 RepID=UPI002AE05933|nr:ABC transporter substrate-binding protein [Aquicoccus sp. G2-2]MEA1112088.1 ABC transporter substrate-binding protein [Aquicoccus sp. G2-2]
MKDRKVQTDTQTLDRLADAAREGRISRRSFMHYSMAAGIGLSAATGLWGTSAKAQPKRGGTFRIAQHDGNTGDSHDPRLYASNADDLMAHTFRAFLTQINTDGTLGPDVAMEWSANSDASEWSFKLNPKARFHSGGKVTAEDVVASMNFHRGEKSTSTAKALLSDVIEIAADDAHTVTFKMESGNADLPWLMTDYHFVILPRNGDGSANWQSGDGCGPYRLVNWEPGINASFTRFEDWHGEGAYFDAVEVTFINDPNARQTALVTGDADATSLLENKTMAMLMRHPEVDVINLPSAQTVTWPMFCDVAPFDNVDVRNAIKLSVNRQDMIDKISFGAATVGNDFHHSPAMPYWPSDIPQREYDPEKARALLKKAGMENLSVQISTADSLTTGAVDAAILYSEHAKASGIDIKVIREPNDGYWSNVWLKKPWCMVAWAARPTPDVMYSIGYKNDAPWNESHWQNERFNKLLLQAKAELNDTLRAEMYRDMALLARDDGGTVIPYFPNYVYGKRKNVGTTGAYAANTEMDGYRAASRWWFDL